MPRIASPIPRSTSKSSRSLSGGVSGVHPSPPTRRAIADHLKSTSPQARISPARRPPPAVGRERGRTSHFEPHPTVDSNATFQTLLPTDAQTPSPFATHSRRTTAQRSHTLEALAAPAILTDPDAIQPASPSARLDCTGQAPPTPRRSAAAVPRNPPPIRTPFRPLYGSGLLPKTCLIPSRPPPAQQLSLGP